MPGRQAGERLGGEDDDDVGSARRAREAASSSATVSTVNDGPGRSISIRLASRRGSPAIPATTIASRTARRADRAAGLVRRLRRPGTTRTRSRPSWSRAAAARPRWPRWNGSNVPPRIPSEPGRTGAATPGPGPSDLPGLRLPFELGRADPDEVARPDPAPPELVVDPVAGERPLEALRRFLDLEVRLRGEPLDPLAADAQHAVVVGARR